ncbi:MAG: O-antigen ligase family protein [Flavobacteriales bacterium]|nr:O-antigen ligase family protein [Flavobacteriales bacterium]MCW8914048.1 O-antigen ligase family protein [Flavobacteriales bacterium]MCW8938106.1 O-antigen ligase family protein [Flavobacteriales bacterium]MCW8968051.1 O-antigen ligase family protein [Flavobacteriales bacterium]MCW8991139.1 O-antigen ligase family protein [Flavobacteriales bacterium]
MITDKLHHQIHFGLTACIAFFIPVYPKLLALFIILLTLNWLVFPKKIKASFQHLKHNKVLFVAIFFYLLYAFGLLYSDNLSFGFKELESKLSFLILPLVYAGYSQETKENITKYLNFFIAGCFVYVLFCFGYATYALLKPEYTNLYGVEYDLGWNYFYYTYLSRGFHPSYSAMFCVLALYVLMERIKNKLLKPTLWVIIGILLLSVFILLLSSKSGWLGLLVMIVVGAYWLIKAKKIKYLMYTSIPLVFFILFNIYKTPNFSERLPNMESIKNAIFGKTNENKNVTTGSDGNASRVFIWKAASEVIADNLLFGAGTGDAKDVLLDKYEEKQMTSELKYQLNAHNQYLSTTISVGILGLFLLLYFLVEMFIKSIRQKNYITLTFATLVGINFLFESMLETRSGIIFFVFFLVLFSNSLSGNNIKITK